MNSIQQRGVMKSFWVRWIPASAGMTIVLFSCNSSVQNPVNTDEIIFSKPGLVDSAVVHECVPDTRRFFTDTLDFSGYSKIKIEFEGNTNSDGSFIFVYYNNDSVSNFEAYSVQNPININRNHSFIINKPSNVLVFEVRLYINPPVCGQGEFKYTRARDLKIYGIN